MPLNLRVTATATATATNKVPELPLSEKTHNSRILVLGGTGWVGGSTAVALSNFFPDLQILVAGRNRCAHSLPFATVDTEEISGFRLAEVLNLVQGKWEGSSNWSTLVDPLNGEPFIKIAEVDGTSIQKFLRHGSKLLTQVVVCEHCYGTNVASTSYLWFTCRRCRLHKF